MMRRTLLSSWAVCALGLGAVQAADAPENRLLNAVAGDLTYQVRIQPGVPAVGQLAEFAVEAVRIPAVPDPVYGERIPVSGLRGWAEIFTPEGDPVATQWVHPAGDAGSYGFHFTSPKAGAFRVRLKNADEEGVASFFHGVATWPLPDNASQDVADAQPVSGPARPAGGPALPAQPGGISPGPVTGVSLHDAMETLGAALAGLSALWIQPGALSAAAGKPVVAELEVALLALAKLTVADGEAKAALDETLKQWAVLKASIEAGKKESALMTVFQNRGCNRCHLKLRFRLIDRMAAFDAASTGGANP